MVGGGPQGVHRGPRGSTGGTDLEFLGGGGGVAQDDSEGAGGVEPRDLALTAAQVDGPHAPLLAVGGAAGPLLLQAAVKANQHCRVSAGVHHTHTHTVVDVGPFVFGT